MDSEERIVWDKCGAHNSPSARSVLRTGRVSPEPRRLVDDWMFGTPAEAIAGYRRYVREMEPAAEADRMMRTYPAGVYAECRVTGRDHDGVALVTPTGKYWYVFPAPQTATFPRRERGL